MFKPVLVDDHVIKTEQDCTLNTGELDHFPIQPAAHFISQENFISCGDGSDDESFFPETRTYNNNRTDEDSDNNIEQDYNEFEYVPECPRFVTAPVNRSKKKQETNNSKHNAIKTNLCETKFATSNSRHIPTGNEPFEGTNGSSLSLKTQSAVAAHMQSEHISIIPVANFNNKQNEANSLCDQKFVTMKSHLDHENIIHTSAPYKCFDKKTSKSHTIRTHNRTVKKDRQICSICGKAFSSISTLNIHIREKHLPDTDPQRYFKCSQCDSKFDREYHLRVHHLTHKNVRTYTCDYCHREYNNRKNFVNHMYAIHSNLRTIYSCSFCNKGFRSRDHRDDHENIHTGKRPNQCMLCFKDFASSAALRRHTKAHKDDADKLLKSDTNNCGADDLKKKLHKKPHKRTKAQLLTRTDSSSLADSKGKYPCEFCTAVFRYKDKRDSHLNKHTGQKPHKCNLCSKTFMSEAYLSKHKKLLHLSEAEKATAVKYECSFCSKIYHRKKVFDKHLKSHNGGGFPFQCEMCSKGYMNQWRLNRHMKKGCTSTSK